MDLIRLVPAGEAFRMSTVVWILIAVVILGVWASGRKKTAPKRPHRIDWPHVLAPDDYECSICRRRFRKNLMICPYCGTKFAERVMDDDEFIEEEDELEEWDNRNKDFLMRLSM